MSSEFKECPEKWRRRVIESTRICYCSGLSLATLEAGDDAREQLSVGLHAVMPTIKMEPAYFKLHVWSCNMAKWPKLYCSLVIMVMMMMMMVVVVRTTVSSCVA
jgi:hypothetical protein